MSVCDYYVNAHDHLSFYDNPSQALAIVAKQNLRMAFVSQNAEEFDQLCAVRRAYPNVKIGFGFHPWAVTPDTTLVGQEERLLQCDFIGEIGLDTVWAPHPEYFADQQRVLVDFFDWATRLQKTCSIHTKGAEKEVLSLLGQYRVPNPMIHWYSGPLDYVADYLALGAYFTISVDLGYSDLTHRLIELLPMDRILTETDGPTALEWVNGQQSNPDYVVHLVDQIAQIKGISHETMRAQIAQNFEKIFPN